MSFLHIDSCECTKSELDLFALPPTQIAIERGEWVEYKPISALNNDSPQIEFTVPGIGEEYMDLSHTLLYLKVKVVKSDGTAISDSDVVAPVNNWMHSLFSQVDIFLNQRQISTPTGNYAYRAYIENILNYNSDSKSTHLKNVMFYADESSKMNEHAQNDGFKKRQALIAGSKAVEMVGHLHCDLFNHDRALLNGVELRLRLISSRASFALMTSTNNEYKIQFLDAALSIRKMKLNPSILIAHSKTLEKCSAKYPITRVDVKTTTLALGLRSYTVDNLINGQLPKRIILGLVNNKATNGDFKTNPFNFQHYNLNYLCLYIDGHQVPSRALKPDYKNSLYAEAYNTLFGGTGIHYSNHTHTISRDDYVGGYALYCYDLTQDLTAHLPTHWNLVRHGSVRVDLGFADAIEEPVNMILYAEYDNIIEIDKRRNVSIDFGN
ncbi:uncharacterized protein F54H12.2-like [Planococcus citri]|uniref:uncharacterized protein F54H12.2-like n=1 Tax=Planococcus citri TaxID=170843 RepID=UPI0031F8F10D